MLGASGSATGMRMAEVPGNEQVGRYAASFLITTAGLHLVGAVGGLLLLESRWGNGLECTPVTGPQRTDASPIWCKLFHQQGEV